MKHVLLSYYPYSSLLFKVQGYVDVSQIYAAEMYVTILLTPGVDIISVSEGFTSSVHGG